MHTRILVSLLSLFLIATLNTSEVLAQSEVVSVGPGYGIEAFYDLEEGIAGTSSLDEWDIGFQIAGFTSSIITNGGAGIRLYVVPDKSAEDFGSTVDTNGMVATWKPWYNSASSWDQGAFNLDSDYQTGDFGWGAYNMVTHTVAGTTLYVIVLPDGTAKQIVIDGLSGGKYSFRYADTDGGNVVNETLTKNDYAGKNFGYYSIRNRAAVDREPHTENWDLVFGKYIAWVGANNETPYVVTGVRSNAGVTVAEVETSNPAGEPDPFEEQYSDNITEIGHDWKEFSGAWSLRNVVYFVRDAEGAIHRLYFTSFAGSSTGDIGFTKEKLGVSSVVENGRNVADFGIHPNVVERGERFDVVISLNNPVRNAHLTLFDAAGRAVYSRSTASEAGLRRIPVSIDQPAGSYIVSLDVDGVRVNQRLIVR